MLYSDMGYILVYLLEVILCVFSIKKYAPWNTLSSKLEPEKNRKEKKRKEKKKWINN